MTRPPTRCRHCGTTDVVWRQSKAGRWVLMNTTGIRYDRTYLRGPHFQTCTARKP